MNLVENKYNLHRQNYILLYWQHPKSAKHMVLLSTELISVMTDKKAYRYNYVLYLDFFPLDLNTPVKYATFMKLYF